MPGFRVDAFRLKLSVEYVLTELDGYRSSHKRYRTIHDRWLIGICQNVVPLEQISSNEIIGALALIARVQTGC